MQKLVLAIIALSISVLRIHGQGSIAFVNFSPNFRLEAPVFNVDGKPLEGDRYVAQLLGGSDPDNLGFVEPKLPTEFVRDGFFNGGGRRIPGVPPNETAFLKVLAWDTQTGSSFDEASVKAMSSVFTVSTCCSSQVTEIPNPLLGMESFSLVPEPSVWGVSVVALLTFALCRRRPRKLQSG